MHECIESNVWGFEGAKRAKVNRIFFQLCFWFCGKKAAEHQISIQFEFVYSLVMLYNGILIEFTCVMWGFIKCKDITFNGKMMCDYYQEI